MERTLILLKPDAVQRGLVGQVLTRFEQKGLKLVALKLMQITPDLAAKHYEAHKERKFYPGLVKFMTSSPVVALALEGIDAIKICRTLMGATFGADAAPARSAATSASAAPTTSCTAATARRRRRASWACSSPRAS
jgi:nucleoside-diphosphate kinase